MKTRSLAVLLLAALAFTLSACLGTSAPFKTGAAAAGPLLTDELAGYVAADTALSPADKAALSAAVDQLRKDTADQKTIDYAVVAADWARVKPAYLAYIQADSTLSPTDKDLRTNTSTQFDVLIAAEQARHAALLSP
jgi:hypothetical protein